MNVNEFLIKGIECNQTASMVHALNIQAWKFSTLNDKSKTDLHLYTSAASSAPISDLLLMHRGLLEVAENKDSQASHTKKKSQVMCVPRRNGLC